MIEHEILMVVAAPLFALSSPLGVFLQSMPRDGRLAIIRWAHKGPAAFRLDAAGDQQLGPVHASAGRAIYLLAGLYLLS